MRTPPSSQHRAQPKARPLDELASELDALVQRVRSLTVSRRDPESFFVERGDIAHKIRNVADQLRRGGS